MRSASAILLTCIWAATGALAASRTSAPEGCVSVNHDGSAEYTSIQAAVDTFSNKTYDAQCIFIYPGNYSEQVFVPWRAAQFTIYGHTEDTSDYVGNTVTITGKKSQALNITNDQTATLRVHSPDFKLYNVNVENTYGEGWQAVAVSAQEDSGYYGCQFWGYQDTLLAEHGRQVYAKTLIAGATDFIFGKTSLAWFQNVDIRVIPPVSTQGYITGMYLFESHKCLPFPQDCNSNRRTDPGD